jgi:hypothetical protein
VPSGIAEKYPRKAVVKKCHIQGDPAHAIPLHFVVTAKHSNALCANACYGDALHRRVIASHHDAEAVEFPDQPRPLNKHVVLEIRINRVFRKVARARVPASVTRDYEAVEVQLNPGRSKLDTGGARYLAAHVTCQVTIRRYRQRGVKMVGGMVVAWANPVPRNTIPESAADDAAIKTVGFILVVPFPNYVRHIRRNRILTSRFMYLHKM